MTRFRKWIATAAIVMSLLLSLPTVVSADPSGRKGGGGGTFTTTSDCFDPGTGGTCGG